VSSCTSSGVSNFYSCILLVPHNLPSLCAFFTYFLFLIRVVFSCFLFPFYLCYYSLILNSFVFYLFFISSLSFPLFLPLHSLPYFFFVPIFFLRPFIFLFLGLVFLHLFLLSSFLSPCHRHFLRISLSS
jgi:hypothetical protein